MWVRPPRRAQFPAAIACFFFWFFFFGVLLSTGSDDKIVVFLLSSLVVPVPKSLGCVSLHSTACALSGCQKTVLRCHPARLSKMLCHSCFDNGMLPVNGCHFPSRIQPEPLIPVSCSCLDSSICCAWRPGQSNIHQVDTTSQHVKMAWQPLFPSRTRPAGIKNPGPLDEPGWHTSSSRLGCGLKETRSGVRARPARARCSRAN